jgi:hypothetical protein
MPAGFTATASVFYSGQSGRPWSALYGNDYNGDGRSSTSSNDLLYIPASADEGYVFTRGTFEDLMTFVNSEQCLSDYIGKTHERNVCRAPWQNTLDFKFNLGLPIKRAKVELTWDVLNLLNLIDSESGIIEYANFNDLLVVRPSVSSAGVVTYDLRNFVVNGVVQTPNEQFTRNDLASRWQMQFGARIRF